MKIRGRQLARATTALVLAATTMPFLPAGAADPVAEPGKPPTGVFYLRSSDGGDDFKPLELDDFNENVNITHVDAEDGTVHNIWDSALSAEDEDENAIEPFPEVRYRRSSNGGRTFSPSVGLNDPVAGKAVEPHIKAEGETVHATWIGEPLLGDGTPDPDLQDPNIDDVYYVHSDDDGQSFSAPVNLTDSDTAHNRDPVIAADGELVAIVFEDGLDYDSDDNAVENDEVVVIRSLNGGIDWEDPVNVSTGPGNPFAEGVIGGFERDDEPSIGVSGDSVHVVWRNRPSDPDVDEDLPETTTLRYSRSLDSGATFSAPMTLPGPETTAGFMAVSGDSVHIVACDDDADDPNDENPLHYWRSTDNGVTFDRTEIFSDTNKCGKPAIDASGDHVDIAFEHEVLGQDPEFTGPGTEIVDGQADVFYLRSDDGGDTFEGPDNVSGNHGASEIPSVSIDPADEDDVHLVWNDDSSFLFTLKYGQELPGIEGGEFRVGNEDVVRWQHGYEKIVDGSDVGLRNFRIDAVARLSQTEFVLSFTESGRIPGIGWVDDSDLVLFTATSLGNDTAGTFSRYFDASDVGLNRSGEDINAVDVEVVDGAVNLYLSTEGNFELSDGTSGKDEDIFACYGATLGADSACTSTAVVFNGSEHGLGVTGGDLDAFSFSSLDNNPESSAFFSTRHDEEVGGVAVEEGDVVSCAFPEEDPAGTLVDCGGANSPMRNVFPADFHTLEENVSGLDFDDRLFDFAGPEVPEEDEEDEEDEDDEL